MYVYFVRPTADKSDEMLEAFYEDVSKAVKLTKKHDLNKIMGNFNVKIGKGKCGNIIGPFGLRDRNERGDRLEQFCEEGASSLQTPYSSYHHDVCIHGNIQRTEKMVKY